MLEPGQDAGDLVRQALTIGYEQLLGVMTGDVDTWRAAGLPIVTSELVDAPRLDRAVVDVRQHNEHQAGHIPDAILVELGDISSQAQALPPGGFAVMCGHGERAATAASLLERQGRTDVAVVIGGPDDWATGGRRLTTGT